MKAFADAAGIVEHSDSLAQELEDPIRDGLVELFQFAAGVRVELNTPGHIGAGLPRAELFLLGPTQWLPFGFWSAKCLPARQDASVFPPRPTNSLCSRVSRRL